MGSLTHYVCAYKITQVYHKNYDREIVRNDFSKMVSESPWQM